MAMLTDIASLVSALGSLASVQYNSAALSSSTAAAGQLSGSLICIMVNTGATPGTYTTRTYTQMMADSNLFGTQTYLIILCNNQATGVLTLAGGTGVTAAGTLTVAANTARIFTAAVSSGLITITGQAMSWTTAV